MTKYEAMRTDPTNWKLGFIYFCEDDPRIVVRTLLPVGWTWNFANRKVYIAIPIAIAGFLMPPWLAWLMGVRSTLAIGVIAAAVLIAIVSIAARLAREPAA